MLEFLFEVLSEFLLQVLGQALIELGVHSLAEPFRTPPNPWLAGLGFLFFGAILGGLSLAVFPTHFLAGQIWRILNLVLTPLAVGGTMSLMGAWRAKRGDPVMRVDRFAYGYLFALGLALVRFWFAA